MDRYCGCPYCEAVFRAPDEKLQQRDGMVRCGACREVFDANVNMMKKTANGFELIVLGEDILKEFETDGIKGTQNTVSDENAHSLPPPEPFQESAQVSATTGLVDTENNQLLQEISHNPGQGDERNPDEFREFQPDTIENPFAYGADREHDLSGIKTDDSAMEGQDIEHQSFESQEVEDQVDHRDENPEPVFEVLDINPESSTEPKVELDLQDAKMEEPGDSSSVTDPEQDESIKSHSDGYDFVMSEGENIDTDNRLSSGSSVDADSQPSLSYEGNLGRMTRNGVDEYINDRPNPLLSITWFLVALGFVFLLGMQVKYFFVERYAQDETYRKYLIGFCKVASCELAPRRDPFRYTLTHTKIDLHPTQPGALRVTVKLVNEADFAQPYPHLQLTLTDRVGRVVGRRTFPPDFYLPDGVYNMIGEGELASVLFDLARPHEKAVGFVVEIVTEPFASS